MSEEYKKPTWQITCPRFKPILGTGIKKDMTADQFFGHVLFPVIATPKFDGIRCITLNDPVLGTQISRPVCRSLDNVPNWHIFTNIAASCPPGLDGEIMTYSAGDLFDSTNQPRSFNQIQSDVMSEQGEPLFKYFVFDYHNFEEKYPHLIPYDRRLSELETIKLPSFCVVVPIKMCHNREDIESFEHTCVEMGYEGVCWRHYKANYKYGRSTLRSQELIKMKRFTTDEAVIVDCYEEMQNTNPQERNSLGELERSSHKEKMVGKNRLGGFMVKWRDYEFNIGSGFNHAEREQYWNKRESLIGRIITFKYQSHGMKERPRTPIFVGFRDRRDL